MGFWRGGFLALALCCGPVANGCRKVPLPKNVPDAGAQASEQLSEMELYTRTNARLEACYQDARQANPEVAVDTVANYVVRQNRVTFVDIEIPAAPNLAECVRHVIVDMQPLHPARGQLVLGMQRIRVDVNGVLALPTPEKNAARYRDFLRRARDRGALQPADLSGIDAQGPDDVRPARRPEPAE